MFEEWLSVAYSQDRQKTAQRQLVEKLKLLPNDELYKAAMGDPTSKLAYVDGPSDERDSWIGKYKGSPLFQKAVELEKALLQIDMEENQRRAEESAEPKASSDSYERKDAIKLQQRMLDLDLAMEGAGVENPEAKEEQGVQLLEQAQQQEAAAGEGNEPHEKAEDAAIQQFRGAQQQEAAAPAKTEVKVGNAMDMRQLALSAGKGLKSVGKHTNKLVHDHPYGTAGLAFAAGHSHGKDAAEEKTAGTLGSDTRRVAPGSNNEVLHGGSTQGNGTLGDYQPTTDDHFGNVSEGLQVNKTAAALSLSNMDGAGRLLAKLAKAGDTRRALETMEAERQRYGAKAEGEKAHPVMSRLKSGLGGAAVGGMWGGLGGAALGRTPASMVGGGLLGAGIGAGVGGLAGSLRRPGGDSQGLADMYRDELDPSTLQNEVTDSRDTAQYIDENPGKVRANRALAGGVAGAALGAGIGHAFNRTGAGALVGGGVGALASALPRPSGASFHQDANEIEQYLKDRSHGKTAAIDSSADRSQVHAAVARKYPALASESKSHRALSKNAGLGTSLVGAGQKALTAGKGMLAGAGGIGGLASKGLGLAKANPLATAGIAGAAGLAGGAMLARPKQASLDLKKLTKGVTQAPLG